MRIKCSAGDIHGACVHSTWPHPARAPRVCTVVLSLMQYHSHCAVSLSNLRRGVAGGTGTPFACLALGVFMGQETFTM